MEPHSFDVFVLAAILLGVLFIPVIVGIVATLRDR